MTNDTSTLYGSLLEMKDQLIYELGEKGVTASYDGTTGLLGLIGKISEIEQGGSCYHILFDSASYTTTGTATVSVTVLKNYSACVGETVSFTSSASTSTTATTDSNGVATATITFSESTTLTASIGGVSDTATITVSSYLFYDDCTSDRSSEYTNASIQSSTKTNYLPMNYDSTNHRYSIKATSNEGNHYIKEISTLTGTDNIRLSAEVMTDTLHSNNRLGLVVGDSTAYKSTYFIITSLMQQEIMINNNDSSVSSQSIAGLSANTWYKMVWEIQGTSFTFKLLDMSDNELYTKTGTFPSTVITSTTTKRYGLYYLNYYPTATKYYRNIKVEAL